MHELAAHLDQRAHIEAVANKLGLEVAQHSAVQRCLRSHLDTLKREDDGTFSGAVAFNQDIGRWDVASVASLFDTSAIQPALGN